MHEKDASTLANSEESQQYDLGLLGSSVRKLRFITIINVC